MDLKAYFLEHEHELVRLEQHFKANELAALKLAEASQKKYLCFRLDGIKASKRFLKDSLSNKKFYDALRLSIQGVYRLFRQCTGREYGERVEGNFFLCAICVSDEVSFVLNSEPNHLEGRLFKTGTSLAGTLSGAMSLNYKIESKRQAKVSSSGRQYPMVVAFDARPLILDDYATVETYILSRWLLAGRNALTKVLRLAGVLTGNEAHVLGERNELARLCDLVAAHELEAQYREIMTEFTLFVPTALTHEASFQELRPTDGTGGIAALCEKLSLLKRT